jgi:Uma2 family endonuclease
MNAEQRRTLADLPRRTLTVRDVERMGEAGILREDERVELIFGELIPMNAKGARHETVKRALLELWFSRKPVQSALLPETTLRLSPDTFIEPDFLIFPRAVRVAALGADAIELAVEISDTSLAYDLEFKPRIYAHFGIRELWVIDVIGGRIHVHRDPEDGRYLTTSVADARTPVTPAFAPADFAVRLGELDLENL